MSLKTGNLLTTLAYFQAVLDSLHESLLVLDSDLRVKQANRSFYETFRVTPDETLGQLIYDLGNGQWNIPPLRDLLEQTIGDSSEVRNFEVTQEFPRIGRRVMLLNARSVDRPEEMEKIVVLAIDDITERKQTQQALELYSLELSRSNEELERFAYVASHDLQEPLRMVASYMQLLERRYKGQLDKDADEFIAFAVDGATRMKTMINDLLAYSRLGAQGQPFELTNCQTVLETVLINLQVAIAESGATVTSDPLPVVNADASQLVQLFQNLIANAIKFRSDHPPLVHIGAERRGADWLFSVRDNGIGLDPQYADRIFMIFQRLHGRNDYSGTGIGLAMCKKIVERHGGQIWVESQLGHGATFYLTLPVGNLRGDMYDSD